MTTQGANLSTSKRLQEVRDADMVSIQSAGTKRKRNPFVLRPDDSQYIDTGKTKLIPLTKGESALVDEFDYLWLSSFCWYMHPLGKKHYAMSRISMKLTAMHRLIMRTPKGMETDHINGNGLDNRRSNLRICTKAQNQMNRNSRHHSSGFKGVYRRSEHRWAARIQVHGDRIHLGVFRDPTLAAIAYDEAAMKYFGEFASPNFPDCADLRANGLTIEQRYSGKTPTGRRISEYRLVESN